MRSCSRRVHSNFKNSKVDLNTQSIKSLSHEVEMATQNVAPAVHSGSRKGRDASQSSLKDGQSVSKRLQQDLMTLMVRLRLCGYFVLFSAALFYYLCFSFCLVDGWRSHCDRFPRWRQPLSLGGHCRRRQRDRIRRTQIQALSRLSFPLPLHGSYCQVCHTVLSP